MGVLRTALYCRLSKDDMAQGDSESIKTQYTVQTNTSSIRAVDFPAALSLHSGRQKRVLFQGKQHEKARTEQITAMVASAASYILAN